MIDGLPAGSIFAFLWNFLISISFQFVGFMLTYLLHTSHAAKFGSRAGLGVTLIQYGLYSREAEADIGLGSGVGVGDEIETSAFGARGLSKVVGIVRRGPLVLASRSWLPSTGDSSASSALQNEYVMSSSRDWLSFLLMTIGWFLLLSSLLGFARVKRWERGIRTSSTPDPSTSTAEDIARDAQVRHHLRHVFGVDLSQEDEEETGESVHGNNTAPARSSTEARESANLRRDLREMGLI